MPKIKRWFPVSHDINSDPEVWELTDKFGDGGLRVLLECFSIADRNEGEIKGDLVRNSVRFGPLLGKNYRKSGEKQAKKCLELMLNLGWIELRNGSMWLVKYAEYHKTRETNKLPSRARVPSEPSEPNLTNQEEEKEKEKEAASNDAERESKKPHSISYPEPFLLFWKVYPKKTKKDAALRIWKRLKLESELTAILRKVEEQRNSPGWQEKGGQYIPNPATYLNEGRWKDEGSEIVTESFEDRMIREAQEREHGNGAGSIPDHEVIEAEFSRVEATRD